MKLSGSRSIACRICAKASSFRPISCKYSPYQLRAMASLRVEFQGFSVLRFDGWPVPVVELDNARQRQVGFPERIINFQRPGGCRFRLREDLLWRHVATPGLTQGDIRVGEACISQSIVRVFLNRLLEVRDAFPRIAFAIIVPLEEIFVRFGVDGASARQVDFLRWRQLRFDLIRDGVGSLALK